jgi:hypothetical protein
MVDKLIQGHLVSPGILGMYPTDGLSKPLSRIILRPNDFRLVLIAAHGQLIDGVVELGGE